MDIRSLNNGAMENSHFVLADAQEPYEATAQHAQERYDEAALGVECAWPAAEREALLTLS